MSSSRAKGLMSSVVSFLCFISWASLSFGTFCHIRIRNFPFAYTVLVYSKYMAIRFETYSYTGSSKKMDGIWNSYNVKSTGRICTFGVLQCSETFHVSDVPYYISIWAPFVALETETGVNIAPASQGHPLAVPVSTTSASAV